MLKLGFTLLLFSAFPHCNECVDYHSPCVDNFAFNLVDKTTNNNLAFGPNAVYSPDSVNLTASSTGLMGPVYKINNAKFESNLYVPVDTIFLTLSATDTDTILMKYDFVNNDCCANDRHGKTGEILFNGKRAEKKNGIFIFQK